MNPELHERYRDVCRENGWRCTHQRFIVYSFMAGNRTHPGVDEVWSAARKEIPRITRESVFRILCEFAELGIVKRLDNLTSARFDSCTTPHGHFICTKCGKVFDFELPPGMAIPSALPGAEVSGMEIRLTGLCPKHARKKTSTTKKGK